jgi:hypothetical protein
MCLLDLQDVQGQSVPIVITPSTQMPDWCLDQTKTTAIRILCNSSFINNRTVIVTDDNKCRKVRQLGKNDIHERKKKKRERRRFSIRKLTAVHL